MQKGVKQAIIAVLIFAGIIAAYILSAIFMEDNIPAPRYEKYDQSNRLDRIREGLQK